MDVSAPRSTVRWTRWSTARSALRHLVVATVALATPHATMLGQERAVAPPSVAQPSGTPAAADGYIDPELSPRPAIHPTRVTRAMAIDGRLDEVEWQRAELITGFRQQLPRTGLPATFPTVVRVLYDDEQLYIGAENMDPEPQRAITAGLERDFNSGDSDLFGMVFDTFLDRRNAFLFLVNPHGAVRDEQVFNDSRTVVDAWEGIIQVRTQLTDSSWIAEIAIPLRSLRFDASKPVQDWGANFIRRVRRVNESSYWAPLERQYRLHRMSQAGTLTGLEGLRQGRNLQLKPYVVASRSAGAQVPVAPRAEKADAGFDAKYGLTPSLTLDATYNTDFSQVEVDQEQVNLTRFSLFFPERREFFIENAGAFTFGDVEERGYRMGATLRDFTLFNSRRIGISRDGRPTPIAGGARLSGRVAGWSTGLLDMYSRSAPGQPGEHFSVARARRNLFDNSDVGVLVSSRTGDGQYNRSYGVDANVRPLANTIVNAYLAASDATGDSSDGYAARTSVAYRGRLWDNSVMLKQISARFDPGLGFVRRRGMRQAYATSGVHARPSVRGIQELNPYVEADYITGLSGDIQSRELTAGTIVQLQPDGELSVELRDQFDRLDAPFTIFPGRQLTAGPYAWRDATVRYQSGPARSLSGSITATGGGFYDGTRRSAGASLAWRARYDVLLEGAVQRNRVDRDSGGFTADLASVRLRFAPTTRISSSAFVQYNTQSRAIVTNARLNWRYAPLSDVFLVLTERHDSESGLRNERSVALKVTRMEAF